MSDDSRIRISVEPTPSDREMAAITAAVLTVAPKATEPEHKPVRNAWREAGKREALRIQELDT